MSVNKVLLILNLGQNPEIKTFENGKSDSNCTMATSKIYKDHNTGEKVEKTEWHRTTAFNPLAEGISKSMTNLTSFWSKGIVMKRISQLRNFKAKVDKELEQTKDERANYPMKRILALEDNMPEDFFLHIPTFHGQEPQDVLVEINIDPNTLDCSLISLDANDYLGKEAFCGIKEQIIKIT